MKETVDVTTESGAKKLATRIKAQSSRKVAPRKASAKRSAASSAGYGGTAKTFIAKGKSTLGDAYTWAEEAGSSLPRRVRGMRLPNPKTMREFIVERPLVLGAVGLGIGMALGWVMPSSIGGARSPANSNARRAAGAGKSRRK